MLANAVAATRRSTSRTLDACGGSGYVSRTLRAVGVKAVLVDISPEGVDRWRRKAQALGHEPDVRLCEIGELLSKNEPSWDLIVLSSALHHFENYRDVVTMAAKLSLQEACCSPCSILPQRAGNGVSWDESIGYHTVPLVSFASSCDLRSGRSAGPSIARCRQSVAWSSGAR
jgi:hypothetical protein